MKSIFFAILAFILFIHPGSASFQYPVKWSRLFEDAMVTLTTSQLLREVITTTRVKCGTLCLGNPNCFGFEYTKMEASHGQRSPGSCRLIRGSGAANLTAVNSGLASGTDVFWLHGVKTREANSISTCQSNSNKVMLKISNPQHAIS
jgi:hypothetical protein